jgi:TolB-like protein
MNGDASVRLASIVCADIAGYSARTEADAATAAAEVLLLRQRLAAIAAKHGGRIFSTGGDSVMMEFAAARQAVAAVVDLLDERPEDEPQLRVGAHLGDVTVTRDGDLLGHGVNVAARLASSSKPCGALISRELKAAAVGFSAREMPFAGEIALAKMQTKIDAFEISPANATDVPEARQQVGTPTATPVAVLPFANMSPNPDEGYLSDGLTEDIITDLARWRSLAVVSRNSTFRYKGKQIDAIPLGRELGVRFLVTGSVRRIGDRLRISVQLIDAETGKDVWAERFDRPAAELFDVQDEVVRTIVGTLAARVQASEVERVRRKPTSSLAAYELTLRGNWLNWADPVTNAEARAAFEQAIKIDPHYGLPNSLLAVMFRLAWVDDLAAPYALLDQALILAKRGVELADAENASHMALAYVHLYRQEFDLAHHCIERALELNPANPRNQAEYGMMQPFLGRPDVALEYLHGARKADPYLGPHWYWHSLGLAHFTRQRYAEALPYFERSGASKPRTLALTAACRMQLGDIQQGQALAASLQGASLSALCARVPFKHEVDRAHLAACLTLAGFSD